MIGKAKSITYGINDLRYITGESRNKKHPELIYHVKDNLLPCGLDAQGVWDMVKAKAPTGKNLIRIEVSPAKEHTENFSLKDWEELWDDFVREYDNIEMKDKNGKIYSHKTNLANSIYSVWLHLESDSGTPHLHGAVCRKDNDGRTNNDHNIHLRAQYAAERVAMKRGWITAAEIHRDNALAIGEECMEILHAMPLWSWEDYVARVQAKGYTLQVRPDKDGKIKGYTVGKNNRIYKASELGTGRKLMASKLEETWKKLHPQAETEQVQKGNSPKAHPVATPVINREIVSANPVRDYSAYMDGTTSYEFANDGGTLRFHIPDDVLQLFDDEFDYRETANHKELTDYAVALFVGLIGAQEVPSGGGGGGSQSELPWRDKNEDDLERARRCARAAVAKHGKQPKTSHRR